MGTDSIAHYRIGAKLGEGGMGEVYRATDTKLQRDVALKLLPEAFTAERERLERFRREARSLAALSHPNIGAIHGIEESEGRVALVLELIEGDTLAERIAAGALALGDAVAIATQIARALEAAHERGIVHRDLKPANVKLTPAGQVKVLDFGLAKSVDRRPDDRPEADVTRSSGSLLTVAAPGTILGTPTYMSPEQAKGLPVDRRTDIWAFGAILFEMLTGRRLFEGANVTEVLAAVISTEPRVADLPSSVPRWLRDLVERCLRRDPTMRLPDIAAARIALVEGGSTDGRDTAPAAGVGRRRVAGVAAATLLVGVLAGALGITFLRPPPPVEPTTFGELVLEPPPLPDAMPAIAPDGLLIAYTGGSETQRPMLYLRSLTDGTTRAVPGSENGVAPSFSPDGKSLVFMAAGRIKTVAIGGGLPEPQAAAAGGADGTLWLADGTIIYVTTGSRLPMRLPAAGGEPQPLKVVDAEFEDLWVSGPAPLPNPDELLVSVQGPTTGGPRVAVLSKRDGSLTTVARGSNPHFVAPSSLVFLQRQGLVIAPFDPRRRALTGPERSLTVPGIQIVTVPRPSGDRALAAASTAGFALYPMSSPEARRLVWVDRAGVEKPTGFAFDAGNRQAFSANGALGASLSPNGRQVALIADEAPMVVDLADVDSRRLLPRFGQSIAYPRWAPDGEQISMIGNETGEFHGYLVSATGESAPRRFTRQPQSVATSFFPDGRSMLGYVVTNERGRDLWVFGLDGEGTPLLETPANERAPMVAPDGRAFVYVSDETGEDLVYLRQFPDTGRAWVLSDGPSSGPLWSRDGREIYYRQDNWMMVVTVDLSAGVRLGVPERLFAASAYEEDPFAIPMYDVAADGRFLMVRRGNGVRTWRWIRNWDKALQRSAKAG